MSEQLDLYGGSIPVGEPAVPAVTFHDKPHRRRLINEARSPCGHCCMNAARFRHGQPVSGWQNERDVTVLPAVYLITQRDGSTLFLCDQHRKHHETARRNHHG